MKTSDDKKTELKRLIEIINLLKHDIDRANQSLKFIRRSKMEFQKKSDSKNADSFLEANI